LAVSLWWFAASLVPSLLPRGWLMQGIVSGIALAVGYGLGLAMSALADRMVGQMVSAIARTSATASGVLVGLGMASWSMVVHQQWQRDIREQMGLGTVGHHPVAVTASALLTAVVLVAVARLVRAAHRGYLRRIGRVLPEREGRWLDIGVATLLSLMVALALVGWTVRAVRDDFAAADARYDVDVTRPSSALRSGSPASLVTWEELGRKGRSFSGSGPSRRQLAAFGTGDVQQPIRIYIGLASAETARDRAELAVAELDRTGAFDREVLLLVTPTGTGWVDQAAVNPLEYLYAGDTAAVAVQYSHQPSWAAMLGDRERAVVSARALLDAVTARLDRIPADDRPRVLLYGQSLGALGSAQLFADLDDVPDHVTGVLWAGAPSATPLWRDLIAERDVGSPGWEPIFEEGRRVRGGAGGTALSRPGEDWETPRIAFLQNATDPIAWWRLRLLLDAPEWMEEPRGPGVWERMPFIPVVTGVQIGLDLLQSRDVPAGYGHVFGPSHAEAWALIAPPQGWSSEDTTRLLAALTAERRKVSPRTTGHVPPARSAPH
jgi:uncharacterized membrane protein